MEEEGKRDEREITKRMGKERKDEERIREKNTEKKRKKKTSNIKFIINTKKKRILDPQQYYD